MFFTLFITAIFFNNVEYRYTLYEKGWFVLQGNIFTDFTTYRNPREHTNKLIKSDNLVVNSGLGLRFIHKTIYDAIIRVDYGWNIVGESNNGIVVGIGQYF